MIGLMWMPCFANFEVFDANASISGLVEQLSAWISCPSETRTIKPQAKGGNDCETQKNAAKVNTDSDFSAFYCL